MVYGGIAVALSLFLVFYCGPKWGKKNMLVYISVCSLIGSLSVVFTQGLGSAIVHSITYKNENQFTNWFIYLVLGIVIITLVIEIVYLNKALNLFNTALVTPTYYVIFTTLTIVSSIVLYQGFDASPVDIATCVLGFLSICSGVALLHNSKSQPDVEVVLRKDEEDDEKILLDEQSQPIVRRKSVFQMFETKNEFKMGNMDDESGHHGSQNPGAADLFPAPFSGISRYASTTKRSQSIIAKNRLQSNNTNNANEALSSPTKTRPHSNTISIGNTVVGEEGYNRELRWRDHATPRDISSNNPIQLANTAGQYHSSSTNNVPMHHKQQQSDTAKEEEFVEEDLNTPRVSTSTSNNNTFSVFTRKHSSSLSSSSQHRAQNELDPLSSFRMQIHHGGESEDREGLVKQQQHHDWDKK